MSQLAHCPRDEQLNISSHPHPPSPLPPRKEYIVNCVTLLYTSSSWANWLTVLGMSNWTFLLILILILLLLLLLLLLFLPEWIKGRHSWTWTTCRKEKGGKRSEAGYRETVRTAPSCKQSWWKLPNSLLPALSGLRWSSRQMRCYKYTHFSFMHGQSPPIITTPYLVTITMCLSFTV